MYIAIWYDKNNEAVMHKQFDNYKLANNFRADMEQPVKVLDIHTNIEEV